MPSMFPVSHKTVFVLDHSSYFAQPCGEKMNYDVYSRAKNPGIIPANLINKPLWTCSVECLFEYMRIVFDVYPTNRIIRVVVGDQSLNSWVLKEMNMNQLAVGLANIGAASTKREADEFSVVQGLTQAVEALCQMTPQQQTYMASPIQETIPLINNGKIICMTHIKSDSHLRSLEECVVDAVSQHNKLAAVTEGLMPIKKLELVFIHITPTTEQPIIKDRPRVEVTGDISSYVYSTQSGIKLYEKMVYLVQKHYDLASTTVTGIPMKEEQNAQSSANYDVELLHPSAVHTDYLNKLHTDSADGGCSPTTEEAPPATITLKWCTPKTNIVELHHCSGCYRITPVDVNSRPSSCLTNFLLSGRAVMLEQPRKTGTKVLSHMLASHGGEIFIHTLPTSRSILEDPPSISEGCGGRVTNYRITDFGEFMKRHKLLPVPPERIEQSFGSPDIKPIQKAFDALERATRFWPIVLTDTILGNLSPTLNPLPTLLARERLTDDEVLDCKKVIYNLTRMDAQNESLPVPASSRGKGPKREEQYRQLWFEVESLVRSYADTSEQHAKVLACILDCKKQNQGEEAPSLALQRASLTSELNKEPDKEMSATERSWNDLDKFQKMTEREKQELRNTTRALTPPPAKKTKADELIMRPGGQSLLSLWTSKIKTQHSKRHVEFAGRAENPGSVIVELYQHMKDQDLDTSLPPPAAEQLPKPALKRPVRS